MARVFTLEELAKHNTETDCFIAVNGVVLDVTSYLSQHPGGKKILLKWAGKDASEEFVKFHNVAKITRNHFESKKVGVLEEQPKSKRATKNEALRKMFIGDNKLVYGDLVPYGDPSWYQTWRSPYFNESHARFRAYVRDFVENDIMPYAHIWDQNREVPKEVILKNIKMGLLPVIMGPPYPSEYCDVPIPCGITPQEYNYFHTLILVDELSRCACAGVMWALGGGSSIGLPPILHFARPELKNRIAREVLNGQKTICLAITEPHAGSDVSSIQTTATKTKCGKYYIVNGEKKWITTALTADYFTTAVRTGDGPGGISMLVIERNTPGVRTRRIDCMGALASGTTYIIFEDVKVPVENLIGVEGGGFKYIGFNFNHERLMLAAQSVRFSRVLFEESFKRKTIGARLIDHAVIRNKFGHMIGRIEAVQSWLDNIVYQLTQMPTDEARFKLGGPIALLKVQSSQLYEYCAREAMQIFGGLGFTKGGLGEKVERLYRDMRVYAIGGGSEEVMIDFGVRQAMRFAEITAKL